ncbi:hypothetical protein ASPACDRAFT_36783 [Aspergillus aculeatus ATCC 16872]|uniref:Uncharacterized protein n=1 Tax=Aspergillus aculeatus (strain ATCC 16872 / CBS 172.66 / WB 5094) TaxID=690307 RepID=A0A1L9WG90_ASPA1|nr:uncharacterized protein ASPACDRAFT_36783 [Aspergillus aculeatus ATCC 16872]OJJ95186.1 hypothetical protein ASPACDRAFT_36783 [Aspergillus aculeatus ATCC 16872]
MMNRTPRVATRCLRQQRTNPLKNRYFNARFQSSSAESSSSGSSSSNPALVGGLAGGAVTLVAGYAWYHFSGARTVVKTVKQTQHYADQVKQGIVQNVPEPDRAFDWLRDTVKSYAGFIPGARKYIDTAFDDLEKIKQKHGSEFDAIVRDAYSEIKAVTKKGGSNADTAFEALRVLQKHLGRLAELSGDAAEDILDNHPWLQEKVGGSWDQLKQMGDAYGPQAKEEVNKTWEQVSSIAKEGFSVQSAEKVRQLVQEKKEKLQKLGDEAWQKGLEESKQYLEKNPQLKELVENNADALKQGNFGELWGLVKDSASSGKTEQVEKFVKDKVDQAKNSSSFDLDKWTKMVPGGSDILNQLQSLRTVGEKKGKEAEGVLKETVEELQQVLKKRKDQIEKLASEAKEESK